MREPREKWAPIEGFPNYEVSNFGRVHNIRRDTYLKTIYGKSRWPKVNLMNNGEQKTFHLHRLVALAFVPGYFEGADAKHKDNDLTNNAADNLIWVKGIDRTPKRLLRYWLVEVQSDGTQKIIDEGYQ